jgi:hypothetical protein
MSRSSTEKTCSAEGGQLSADKDQFEVTLGPEDDPQNWSLLKKWTVVFVISTGCLCVTCASAIVSHGLSLKSTYLIFCPGAVHGGWTCVGISCSQGSYNFRHQFVRHGAWIRAFTSRAVERSLWEKHHLPCFVLLIIRVLVASHVRT